ncbi:MAG: membrane protein insertase YidC [Victivallaceae bacterium]
MNKRLLLFIALISVSFFGFQVFLGYKDLAFYKNLAKSQKIISDDIASSILGLSLIDCEERFFDKGIAKHQGVRFSNDSLFLLSKHKKLETVIYGEEGQKWYFKDTYVLPNGLNVSLYKNSDSTVSEQGSKVFLPSGPGSLPILAVEFRNKKEPFLFKGEYVGGHIVNRDFEVLGTCLVFWQSGREYVPFGVYEPTEKRMFSVDLPINRAVTVSGEFTDSQEEANAYYVLQNNYLQLVFSEKTGSLEGVNLPFFNEENQNSVVNEINFDRQIEESSPRNASFPGFPFYFSGSRNINRNQQIGGYYPLLRRGVLSAPDQGIPNRYQALHIVGSRLSENPFSDFRVSEFSDKHVVFQSLDKKVSKRFVLPQDEASAPYCFDLYIELSGTTGASDLWITSGIPEVELLSNAFVPTIKTYSLTNKSKGILSKEKLPKIKHPVLSGSSHPFWVANSNGYFSVILTDLTENAFDSYKIVMIPGETVPTRLSLIDPRNDPYPASKYPGYEVVLPLTFDKKNTQKLRIYAGPLEEAVLNTVDATFTNTNTTTGLNPNYVSCLTFRGIFAFVSEPFARLLFLVMKFFYFMTHSWGIAIILLTVFLKLVLYPLNAWSIKSMRRMQILSPYIQEIQKKYKKEPKRAQAEIMELYKTNKVNPLTGCFPVLIQIPFLIAMFDLLKSSFLLRGAAFIPGWIDNLAAPDVLVSWKTPIFFIGNQLHLLPILLGVVMFMQQKISAGKRAETNPTEQQRQQQVMGTMMTVLFTVMFYKFPSGLNLYWLSSMLLGVLQQWLTNKILDKKHLKNEIILGKISKK